MVIGLLHGKNKDNQARALAKDPKILIFDDSFSALDYKTGKQILKLLQDTCRKENMTVIAAEGLVGHVISVTEKTEKIFGGFCDIEFAVKNDEIFILQSRPITTLETSSPLILDNSNIVESYPNISLPLTISFVKEAYSGVFRGLAERVIKDEKITDRYNETYYNMTGSANGRVYYKLSNWYTVLSFLPFHKKIIPIWQDMMGVTSAPRDSDFVRLNPLKRMATCFNIICEAFSVRKNMEKLNADFSDTEKYPLASKRFSQSIEYAD